MSDFWHAAAIWTAHSMLAGGAALLLAWVALRRTTDPARRHRLLGWAVRAAVVACVLTLLPAWLRVPVPGWEKVGSATEEAKLEPAPPVAAEAVSDEAMELVWVPSDPQPDFLEEEPLVPPAAEVVAATVVTPPPSPAVEEPDQLAAVARVVLIPYWLGVGVVVLRQLVGYVGLARLRRAATPASADVQALAAELSAGRPVPRILVSNRVGTPVCFGVLRPTILLPKPVAKLASPDELRWVLAHELHHLRHGHPRTGVWLGLAGAVYFFLPWFWAVRRELLLAQECLADAAAAGARAADYAAFLVELSSRPGVPRSVRAVPSLAGVRAGRSDLYRRVTMLLQPKSDRGSRWARAWSALAISGAVSAAVVVSGVRLTADEPKPAEKKAEGTRIELRFTADDQAEKRKDGEPKTFKVVLAEKGTADIAKAIEEAAEKGDVETVKKLAAKLKALSATPQVPPLPPKPPVPLMPTAPLPPAPPAYTVQGRLTAIFDDEAQKLEKAVEKLKQAAEEVKDQPEAKAALEKSIAEYHKKIAEAKKKGELNVAGDNGLRSWAFNGNPQAAEQIQKTTAEMMKNYEKQLAELKDDPRAAEAFKQAIKAYKASMDQLAKQMAGQGQVQGFFQAQGQGAGGQWQVQPRMEFKAVEGVKYTTAKTPPGRLGVTVEAVPAAVADQLDLPAGKGVILINVADATPAAKAGLKANDVLLEVSGKAVTAEELPKVIAGQKGDQPFDVVIVRKGKKETVKGVTIPTPKVEPAKAKPAKASSLSVSVNNDQFDITAKEDATTYTLKGTVGDTANAAVTIQTGDQKMEFHGLKSVPTEHREKVEKFLKSVSK